MMDVIGAWKRIHNKFDDGTGPFWSLRRFIMVTRTLRIAKFQPHSGATMRDMVDLMDRMVLGESNDDDYQP